MNLNNPIIQYKIEDYDKFLHRFFKLVDTSVDLLDYQMNPWAIKAEYFGKIKWGKFTVYNTTRGLIYRPIVLKIYGAIEKDRLRLRVTYFRIELMLIPMILGVIAGFSVILNSDYYAGAVVLLFVFVFFFCMIRFFRKKERAFILKIEAILC